MARKRTPAVQGADGPDDFDYKAVGGKLKAHGNGGDGVWSFGWIPPADRSEKQQAIDHDIQAAMPAFSIQGTTKYPRGDKALLFELWKHPDVVQALGYPYEGTHQLTGSCVGAGGGNVQFTLLAEEVIRRADPEKITVPFWLLTYGRSRFHGGMRGRGEGSFGSAFAKAAVEDGVLDNLGTEGLPKPQNTDGLVWGRDVELTWSAGDRAPCTDHLTTSRKHLVKSAARLRSADQVREALVNGYPVTIASMYAFKASVQDGVLLASRQGQWAHQMSLQGWMVHERHGELYWCQNQWGKRAHGTCPTGAPQGGAWLRKADVDWICRDEAFAFSSFLGFPAPTKPLPWVF